MLCCISVPHAVVVAVIVPFVSLNCCAALCHAAMLRYAVLRSAGRGAVFHSGLTVAQGGCVEPRYCPSLETKFK